tara:strand:+ start:47139 stop:47963 length:825 start_codon:yes stop_codon:yes gene_type:complete
VKICIFGASGLIGNGIYKELKKFHSVFGTYKNNNFDIKDKDLFYFDILGKISIETFLKKHSPDIIINTAGITKHLISNFSKSDIIEINTIFPKKLGSLANVHNYKFIHISTDCVFNGKKGNYDENDLPNDLDLYGITKFNAESIKDSHLVLRTSTIGFEKNTKFGLLEWFLSQKIMCEGYEKAIFSGITNTELGKIIHNLILPNINKFGLYNIASEPINKYILLNKLNDFYNKKILINKNISFEINRSLNGELFQNHFNYKIKSWDIMLKELNI